MELPQVTLCAIDSHPVLAIRAMNICMERCEFGDVVLITNEQAYAPFRVAYNDMKGFSDGWYTDMCMRQLINYVNTPFVLLVQYDGYILNPELWDDEFLEYDYIGAAWVGFDDHMIVGNGGFCLRSRKLLEMLADYPVPEDIPEDRYICRYLRGELEQRGIKFAPEQIADRFAYEGKPATTPTFGFHGVCNMNNHLPDREILQMIPYFDAHILLYGGFHRLVSKYFKAGNQDVYSAFRKRMKNSSSEWSGISLPERTSIVWPDI